MPEGDTIHRIARRLDEALAGSALELVEAPDPRSPLHSRAVDLEGATLERAEARGKHLLLHFDADRVVHSHLGMNGRWRIGADEPSHRDEGEPSHRKPWLLLSARSAVAAQTGGKLLRLVPAARARNDPVLLRLGPDPLGTGFDEAAAGVRLHAWEPSERVGEALLDQRLLAGIGNVIRVEALWLAEVSPWRRVGELTASEAAAIVGRSREIMVTTMRTGRRPKSIYGPLARRPCPRCGGRIEVLRQGEGARATYWCPGCQR